MGSAYYIRFYWCFLPTYSYSYSNYGIVLAFTLHITHKIR